MSHRILRPLLPITLVALSGCHLPATLGSVDDIMSPRWPAGEVRDQSRSQVPGRYESGVRGRASDSAMQASLWYDARRGMASFDLSRAAHVALFALRPWGEVELLYPRWYRHGLFHRGVHTVQTIHLDPWSGHWMDQPTYVLLLASDRPFELNRLIRGGALRWSLAAGSHAWSPLLAMDVLVSEILPFARHGEWTAAYQALWPRDRGQYWYVDRRTHYAGGWDWHDYDRYDRRYDDRYDDRYDRPRRRDLPRLGDALPRPKPPRGVTRPTDRDRPESVLRPGGVQRPGGVTRPGGVQRPGGVTRPGGVSRPGGLSSPPTRPQATPPRAERPSRPETTARPEATTRPARPPIRTQARPPARPVTVPRPRTTPRPKAAPRPKAEVRPKVKPRPKAEARPKVKPRPKPAPRPAAKKKGKGSG